MATATYMDEATLQSQVTDPRKIGPGSWFFMQMIAVKAKNREERLWACQQIRNFCKYFKCGDCQGHCKAYVEANPPERSIDNGEDGLFNWVMDFRNSVQSRLKAPLYDRDAVKSLYIDTDYMVCQHGCGAGDVTGPTPRGSASVNSSSTGNSSSVRKTIDQGYIEVNVNPQKAAALTGSFGNASGTGSGTAFRLYSRQKK